MAEVIDRIEATTVESVSGLTHNVLMKSDPVWAQLRGEIAALQTLVIGLKTSYNLLLAKLDTNHAAATDHVSTLGVTLADPKL